jgi:hypothetical protein
MVRGPAVAILGSDTTGQDALDGAAVELFEVLGNHAKSFQSPTVLVCLDHGSCEALLV